MPKAPPKPVLTCKSQKDWEKWLSKNYTDEVGVNLQLFKKDSGKQTLTYDEALDSALCYGWIDGQKNTYDAESWVQAFTPRRKRSPWSKRNIEHVKRLIKEGRMQPSGQLQIDLAKKDGRWDRAYDAASASVIPEDFLSALNKNKKAKAFFETLNKANRYAITYRLQTAKKPETREKRMALILEMMKDGKKFH